MIKLLIGLLASLAWFSTGAQAITKVSIAGITSTQLVIRVTTDQTGNCTYQLSELPDLSVPVNDVNPALFAGSNSDARATSVLTGNERVFVAGLRRGDQGSDGRFYSRALAANTPHYGAVTCGTDAAVPFSLTTHTIAVGNVYMDPLPFDSRALGNYAIPTVDYTDLTKWYVDPQTGFKFKLITGPGHMVQGTNVLYGTHAGGDSTTGHIDGESSGSNWTNASNGLVADTQYATYTAVAQDVLTLRVASSCPQDVCFSFGWQNINGSGNGVETLNVDSYQLVLTGNGNGSPMPVDVALSWNGVTQGTDWYTVTLPAANGAVTYPTLSVPGFAGWQDANYPLVPGVGIQTVEQHATVNTSGAILTWQGGAYFPLDARLMTAGSKITIQATEYTVASINGATGLTLTSSAGTQSNVTAYWSNLSVMIRKHTAAAGTVNVDGLTLTLAFSESYANGGSGFQNHCSHLTSTDSAGNVGRFCLFQTHFGQTGIYWVLNNGQSRFIGRGSLLASNIGVAQDEYEFGLYSGYNLFDTTDPNSWWTSGTLNQSGHVTLVKLTYNPNGVTGCSMPNGYQAITPAASYDPNSTDNCNISATELTRPSLGKDIATQAQAMQPGLLNGKFSQPGLSFVQDGYAVLVANGGSQDTESWMITINTTSGAVFGVYSSYMNTGKGSCRGCVVHGTGASTPTDNWYYLTYNNYPTGSSASGLGPYYLTVATPLTTTPSISTSACQSAVDPSVAWLVPYSDGCDTVTFNGTDAIPCDPDPSTWEAANMPACSWHSGWTKWQAGAVQVGDWFQDPVSGFELFVVGAKTASTLTLLRNVVVPSGTQMTQNPGEINGQYLRAHAANWTLGVWCSYHQDAIINVTTEVNGSGMLWDRKFLGFNHSVLRAGGIISSETYDWAQGPSGQSVRATPYPGAANTPETNAVFNGAPFSGALGTGGSGGYIQAHPGWNSANKFYTDMAPFAPGTGGSFTLWPLTAANVTGSLYKIANANMVKSMNKRRLGTGVWAGMYNFQDISGTGTIGSGPADNYHWCSIDYPGSTCGQSAESVGDVFMNIPQGTLNGWAGQSYDLNIPNATPLGMEPMTALQYFYYHLSPATTGTGENLGRWERRVTTGLGRYVGQDSYSNSKVMFNGNLLVFNCGTPNLQRIGDLCTGPAPLESQDSVTRNDFVHYVVQIPAGGPKYAEVQFGYEENGTPSQFYCTSRIEPCNTSSPAGTPFNWESETRVLTTCTSGCTIQVPVLAARVLYYSLRRSTDGVNWTNGPLQVVTVN